MRGVKNTMLFLHGFFLASIIYFYIESRYEKETFKAIADHIVSQTSTKHPDSLILQSLHLTYAFGNTRAAVFSKNAMKDPKSTLIHPITFDLMTNAGSCGSFSMVLSRILTELQIENRIIQMKVDGNEAGHVVIEGLGSKGWMVLDPSYDLVFRKTDDNFANFYEVGADWAFFSKQVPGNYDHRYDYDYPRYTNWNKIPIIMPVVKSALYMIIGKERTDVLSLRTIFLRKYNTFFKVGVALYLLLLFITYKQLKAGKRVDVKALFEPQYTKAATIPA